MDTLPLPLPQSPEFARACTAMGLPVRVCKRARDSAVTLWWQVQSRRFGPLGRVDLVSRGPVARDATEAGDWLDGWRRWHGSAPLLLNATDLPAEALRAHGFWPLMTPATIALLPLADRCTMRAAMHQKWRNRLNRAETHGLRILRRPLDPAHWLLSAEAEQARSRGYRGLPPALSAAFAAVNPSGAWVFEARHAGAPVAAILILRHGPMATWQIGVARTEGRRLSAMNLLLWEAMGWLSDEGHETLDLGTLNTQDSPGLARFKLGTGAMAQRQGGTWLHAGPLAPLARRLPLRLAA